MSKELHISKNLEDRLTCIIKRDNTTVIDKCRVKRGFKDGQIRFYPQDIHNKKYADEFGFKEFEPINAYARTLRLSRKIYFDELDLDNIEDFIRNTAEDIRKEIFSKIEESVIKTLNENSLTSAELPNLKTYDKLIEIVKFANRNKWSRYRVLNVDSNIWSEILPVSGNSLKVVMPRSSDIVRSTMNAWGIQIVLTPELDVKKKDKKQSIFWDAGSVAVGLGEKVRVYARDTQKDNSNNYRIEFDYATEVVDKKGIILPCF